MRFLKKLFYLIILIIFLGYFIILNIKDSNHSQYYKAANFLVTQKVNNDRNSILSYEGSIPVLAKYKWILFSPDVKNFLDSDLSLCNMIKRDKLGYILITKSFVDQNPFNLIKILDFEKSILSLIYVDGNIKLYRPNCSNYE